MTRNLDRFALGQPADEAPCTLTFTAPDDGWAWSLEGAGRLDADHATAQVKLDAPGLAWVTARKGDAVLRGQALGRAPVPPTLVSVRRNGPAGGPLDLDLAFDRPVRAAAGVDAAGATLAVADGPQPGHLTVRAARSCADGETLALLGLADRRGRTTERLPFTVPASQWPADAAGLVFRWNGELATSTVAVPGGERACVMRRSGTTVLDHAGRAVLGGGLVADRGWREARTALHAAGAGTIFASVIPTSAPSTERSVVAFGGATDRLSIVQKGVSLHLVVARSATPAQRWELGVIQPGRPHLLTVTWRGDRLRAWLDGRPAPFGSAELAMPALAADGADLVFGGGGWSGTVARLAVLDRFLATAEVQALVPGAADAPAPPAEVRVRARLATAAIRPTPASISPYAEALVADVFEIESVLSGRIDAQRILVTRWCILDGTPQPLAEGTVDLRLAAFDSQPQLANRPLSRPPETYDLPLWHLLP